MWRRRLHIEVVPNALPKSIEICNRPLPHSVIAVKTDATVFFEPVLIQAYLRYVRWLLRHVLFEEVLTKPLKESLFKLSQTHNEVCSRS